MKKILIRILCLVFALTMLLPCVVACKKNEEQQGESGATAIDPDLEKLGFTKEDNNGKVFSMLISNTDQSEHYATEYNGNIVNDTVYERNLMVEQYFNIDLQVNVEPGNHYDKATFQQKFTTPISAGDCPYDMIVGVTVVTASILGNKYLLPVNKMDYIDLDKDWWVEDLYDNLQISGNLYSLYGDMNLSVYSEIHAIMFNSQLINSYKLEDPYTLVDNDEWTLEKMFKMAATVGHDVDGIDGVDIERDVMGSIGCTNPQRAFMTGLNLGIIQRDQSTGDPVIIETLPQKFIDAYEMISNAYVGTYNTFHKAETDDYSTCFKTMAADRVLFLPAYLYWMTDPLIAGMEGDYGVVPYPKWNQDQDRYYSQIATGATSTLFPKTLATPELSAKVATYMSYLGQETVAKKYYETYLKDRLSRTPKMLEMLDLIRDTATVTLTVAYAGCFAKNLMTNFQVSYDTNHKDQLASIYKMRVKTYKSELADLMKSYK